MKVFKDRLMVERDMADTITEGGIHLLNPTELYSGVVVEKGEKVSDAIEVGSRIVFGKYAGDWLFEGEKERLVLCEKDCIAVLEG